jgi:hypothetical protein
MHTCIRPTAPRVYRRAAGQSSILLVVAVLVALGVGMAAGIFWARRAAANPTAAATAGAGGEDGSTLSDGTRSILKRIESPVEIRFYTLLDPAVTPEELKSFTRRVDALLGSYEREAGGKIKVTRVTAQSSAMEKAAGADGLKPINLGTSDIGFLGIAVASKGFKETLPRLAPEWEAALEIDLSRAIASAADAAAAASATAVTKAKPDPLTVEELKRALPNLESLSLEEGTRALRDAALKDFAKATEELQSELKVAQERFKQAQASGSETEQQAAMKVLQELQGRQAERLKEIASKSQAQIDALKKLKSGAQ